MQRAMHFQAERKYQASIIELKNALQLRDTDGEARRMLGEAFLRLGKGEIAENELRKARQAGVALKALLPALGSSLLLQNKWNQLLREIQVPENAPPAERARIHALRGFAHIGLQQPEQAEDAFSNGLSINPRSTSAFLGKATLALNEDKEAVARWLIELALRYAEENDAFDAWRLLAELELKRGDLGAADAAFTQAIALAADNLDLVLKRAQVRIELQDYPGAEADLARVARMQPNNTLLMFSQGLLAVRQQQYAKARTFLEPLYQVAPKNSPVLYYLGLAHFAQGDMEQAIDFLSRVAERTPLSDSAARLLGQAYFRLGRLDAAIAVLEPLNARHPGDPGLQGLLGGIYLAQGQAQKGLALLQQSLAKQPEAAHNRAQLGWGLLQIGDAELALKELERAAAQSPGSRAVQFSLLVAYMESKRHAEALDMAERMHREKPDDPMTLNFLGAIRAASGQLQESQLAFSRALELQPDSIATKLNLANLELRRKRPARAKALYDEIIRQEPAHLLALKALSGLEQAEGNSAAARVLLERAVDAHPKELQARFWLSRIYLEQGETEKAFALFTEMQQANPKDPQLLAILAKLRLAAGDAATARRIFESLVRITPRNADAHYGMAEACALGGQLICLRDALNEGLLIDARHPDVGRLVKQLLDLAESDLVRSKMLWKLEQTAPELTFISDLRAQVALKIDRADMAESIYQRLSAQHPDDWVWRWRLASLYETTGKQAAALDTLQRWLRTHPDDPRSYFMTAQINVRAGRRDDAMAAYLQVLRLDPDHAMALNDLAWLLSASEPQRALDYAERAVQLRPGHLTWDTLGVVLLELGENQRAAALFERAIGEQPQSADTRYHLALALVAMDQQQRARALIREILKTDAPFSERNAAVALLRELTND